MTDDGQDLYVAQLLAILAMWASKISSVTLRWRIERNSRRGSWSLRTSMAVALLWGPVCIALTALQCQTPAWKYMGETSCQHGHNMLIAVITLNMATDVYLGLAPLPLIAVLQMPLGRKVRTMILLALRLL